MRMSHYILLMGRCNVMQFQCHPSPNIVVINLSEVTEFCGIWTTATFSIKWGKCPINDAGNKPMPTSINKDFVQDYFQIWSSIEPLLFFPSTKHYH